MSTKRKLPTKIVQPVVKQSAKKPLKVHINEADTAVSAPTVSKLDNGAGEEVIDISSDSTSHYEESDDEEQNDGTESNKPAQNEESSRKENTANNAPSIPGENGDVDMDKPSPNLPTDGESDQEPAAPTFGDLVRANETIDVPSALSAQQSNALAAPGRVLAPPSSASLGTVLTQALRTDDTDLLESCLHTTDLATVRNTIQRLDSTLAGTLLTKLASRMHRRPGRAGSLMTWVQWTLIAHGGALATQPGLTKKLGELHRVLEERSRGLNSLLTLKGKLDLLDAQMQLRRGMHRDIDSDSDEEEDGEEGVVYVEGEDSDAEMVNGNVDADDDDDDFPVTNGIADLEDDSDGEEESSAAEDEDELDAEEEIDENEVDHEDVESEEEESEPEAAPPTKRSRTTESSRRRR